MISAELQGVTDIIRESSGGGADVETDVQVRRKAMEESTSIFGPAPEVTFESISLGGVPCERNAGPGLDEDRAVLYFHGGGYTVGSPLTHRNLTSRLAIASGCVAYSLDYRLAPEDPYPAAVDDAVAAFDDLTARVDARRIVLAGDSAGGGLALACLLRLKDEGRPLPGGVVGISAWTDLAATGESITSRAAVDVMLGSVSVDDMGADYRAGAAVTDPYVSPLYGDYAGAPPLYLQVGNDEILLDDSRRVALRASDAGVDVVLDVVAGAFHVFQIAAGFVPESTDAVARLGRWVRQRTH